MRGQKIWGRTRHVLVETQGHRLAVNVTGAPCSDPAGAKGLLEPARKQFPRRKAVWGDRHSGGDVILWLLVHLGWTIEMVRRPGRSKEEPSVSERTEVKADLPGSSGFRPLPRRWVIERSLAWITRWRRLARDHEGLPQRSEAFLKLSARRRM
jgi:putative transposase